MLRAANTRYDTFQLARIFHLSKVATKDLQEQIASKALFSSHNAMGSQVAH